MKSLANKRDSMTGQVALHIVFILISICYILP